MKSWNVIKAIKIDTAELGVISIIAVVSMLSFQEIFGPSTTKEYFLVLSILAAMIGWFPVTLWRRFITQLTDRANRDAHKTWAVRLNDIEVGTMSDAEYAALCLRTYQDKRVFVAQAFNLVKGVSGLMNQFFIAIPVFAFWLLMLLIFVEPETFVTALAELQKQGAPMTAILHAKQLLYVSAVLWLFGFLIWLGLAGKTFGFVDCFEVAINKALRMHFKTEAEGNFNLIWLSASGTWVDHLRHVR